MNIKKEKKKMSLFDHLETELYKGHKIKEERPKILFPSLTRRGKEIINTPYSKAPAIYKLIYNENHKQKIKYISEIIRLI